MLKLKKVAVTGGLSCGKSLVCRIFSEFGAYVISSDEVVHRLLSPETDVGQKVIQLLGADIVVQDRIDRSKIATKVFNNLDLLKALEQIIHPHVCDEIERSYQQAVQKQEGSLFVVEIPLLFETNFGCYDHTIAVIADEKICKERFLKISGYGEEEYQKRMSRQLSPLEKAKRADFVIRNEDSFEKLKQNVREVYNKIIQQKLRS